MKRRIETALVILIILTGLSLFLYPVISGALSGYQSSHAVSSYAGRVADTDSRARNRILREAEAYNRALYRQSAGSEPTSVSSGDYAEMLRVDDDGMMGYIEIPAISCRLPVYHGTDASTLESYVGHLPSSSLPVGGESTHCVLTGHTGMPSARLLSDLDKLREGDRFTVTTLDRTLIYEVDRILVVLPDETEPLRIEQGADYCTLVTCTPYGVNSHRLLVRGRRVSDDPQISAAKSGTFLEWIVAKPAMIALAALLVMLMTTLAAVRLRKER